MFITYGSNFEVRCPHNVDPKEYYVLYWVCMNLQSLSFHSHIIGNQFSYFSTKNIAERTVAQLVEC